MTVETAPGEPDTEDLDMDLTVNSVVEMMLSERNVYGIIRWIGKLPGRQDIMAGLELVIFIKPVAEMT